MSNTLSWIPPPYDYNLTTFFNLHIPQAKSWCLCHPPIMNFQYKSTVLCATAWHRSCQATDSTPTRPLGVNGSILTLELMSKWASPICQAQPPIKLSSWYSSNILNQPDRSLPQWRPSTPAWKIGQDKGSSTFPTFMVKEKNTLCRISLGDQCLSGNW